MLQLSGRRPDLTWPRSQSGVLDELWACACRNPLRPWDSGGRTLAEGREGAHLQCTWAADGGRLLCSAAAAQLLTNASLGERSNISDTLPPHHWGRTEDHDKCLRTSSLPLIHGVGTHLLGVRHQRAVLNAEEERVVEEVAARPTAGTNAWLATRSGRDPLFKPHSTEAVRSFVRRLWRWR